MAADFVLDTFDPEEEEDELSNERLLTIIRSETTDQFVNELVWKCLGYERKEDGSYINDNVFPKWREKYPSPPDLIGVTRNYTYEIDRPCQKANQQLVASIPMKYKQGVKEHLRPLGFTGFKLEELTPNKTRRAQCVNWLLFYREALRGKTVDQLRAERAAETGNDVAPKVVGPQSRQTRNDDGVSMIEQKDWKYPSKPVL
ncbi:hypothetical protein GUITHDRAFT_154910 [Guillardia theta CCMP2712]|uniref:Uncharacterized protein n=2 Tax=Guillardia theta TaxID=55529 RepID=L1IPH5_GUITC|nr:hypothetical protein GUITHDRAFT_154910 [Guillardia theta CCMP2712]EKX37720.1 hypothetical protein GUITHDRAFT_154910 [Guillardia theta CCMP2712]|eukprot:XP_005824700.1 hypothetical protein GUITHDRAFT_154910 [Guillardia theta CCMP2712]